MDNKQISLYLKVEGDKPLNKIWDFLIIHSEYDYSLKDISRLSGVSYAMTKILFRDYFIPRKLVKYRKVGQAKLFCLDFDNYVVDKFREYYWAIIEQTSQLKSKEKNMSGQDCIECYA